MKLAAKLILFLSLSSSAVSIAQIPEVPPDEIASRQSIEQAIDVISQRQTLDIMAFDGEYTFRDAALSGAGQLFGILLYVVGSKVKWISSENFATIEEFLAFYSSWRGQLIQGAKIASSSVGIGLITGGTLLVVVNFVDAFKVGRIRRAFEKRSIARGLMELPDGPSAILSLSKTEMGRAALTELALHDQAFKGLLLNLASTPAHP